MCQKIAFAAMEREKMADFKHWCGNCQIRVYVQLYTGRTLTWVNCPYTCEYATAMRCLTKCESYNGSKTNEDISESTL